MILNSNTLHWYIVYFHPNFDTIFRYRSLRWILPRNIFKLYIVFWCISVGIIVSILPTFHWTNNHDTRKMKWQFFYCGNVTFVMKDIYNFFMKNKTFIHHYSIFIVFSSMLYHKSHIFLYLNSLNPCIKHLDMFWNTQSFILLR